MRHIILTRYNLPLTFNNSDAAAVRGAAEWLEKRKVLFDRYCLPAMRAQTNKDFDWFVGFAHDTPEEYLNYFDDVAHVIKARSRNEFMDMVQGHYDDGPQKTIISRLDNDDALGRHFVEVTQTMAQGLYAVGEAVGLPHVLNYRKGWEIDDTTNEVYARDYPNSSFFSLIFDELPPNDIFKVTGGHHAHVQKHFPVTNIVIEKPMWMITIHGDNIGNTIKGQLLDNGAEKLDDYFGIR